MASSGSEDARVLMYNKKSNSARTDPLGKSWVKKTIGAESVKELNTCYQSLRKERNHRMNVVILVCIFPHLDTFYAVVGALIVALQVLM